MKFITSVLFSASLVLCAKGGTTQVEGRIHLNRTESSSGNGVFKREFGGAVKARVEWRVGDFFGEETVFAGADVENTTAKTMYYRYYVAFFDKGKKLVGGTGQGGSLEPSEATMLGSCLIELPKNRYKDIVSYQAVLYETDIPPKKK